MYKKAGFFFSCVIQPERPVNETDKLTEFNSIEHFKHSSPVYIVGFGLSYFIILACVC